MSPTYFTRDGHKRYTERVAAVESKLDDLTRKNAEALEQGNQWHDNFAWEQLQREISQADHYLRELRRPLAQVRIVDYPASVDSVVLGCEVDVEQDGRRYTYQIVAYGDDDFESDKILYDTPLAQAIIDKRKGSMFTAKIVNRNMRICILDVRPIKTVKD